ncbi:sensor histidine kinase [Pedobacter nyackensis]|uniref:sensor histidine kinase n=1 Tax=Pedobacter nyackensis TaxID=475255 RepID=UPI002931C7C0|nr:histidine kinase [Pedobacter nyackensis]
MTLKKDSQDFYKYFRFIIIPVIFIGFYLLAYMIDPYRPWSDFFKRNTTEILTEWVFVSIFCLLITEISLAIARALDRKLPWMEYPLSRFFLQLSIQILTSIVFLYIYLQITLTFFGGETRLDDLNSLALRQSFVVSTILSVLISLIFTGNFFLQQWKAAMIETSNLNLKAAELKQIALESELQSLKMQLDPHFMFNNFSTLSALIADDPNAAQHFLENLSRVYRYMIINVHKNIISVEEEIGFAHAYFYLIKIRLGENIKMQITLSDEVLKKGIPPITLQLLIENAIKHNTASRSKPLTINIDEDEEKNLVITNSLQRLNYNIPSTGTGLKNIESRYRLLSDKLPEVTETENLFIVKLPLMNI